MKKIVFFVALSLMLCGCHGTSSSDKNDTFVVGMECNYAPFNWQTTKQTETSVSLQGAGYADGYDVIIAQKIADKLNKKLVIKKLSWDGLQPALESGTIDAIIAGMTADEKRENGIDFTTPYYQSEMTMIVRKGDTCSKFTDIQQFSGKSIVGQKNTNYDTVIDQIKGVVHLTPKQSYPEMVFALHQKEADGITAELPVAQGIVESNPDLTYVKFDEGKNFVIDTSVSIGLKEGSRDSEEGKAIQEALDSISIEERNQIMHDVSARVPANQ